MSVYISLKFIIRMYVDSELFRILFQAALKYISLAKVIFMATLQLISVS